MPLQVERMIQSGARHLEGRRVFLSSSIPDPKRWRGDYDTVAITDAVVAATRALLTAGAGLVTAAHPTIAPLILYVAREFPDLRHADASIIVYQSKLFEDVLPEETYKLAEGGLADLRWTNAHPDDRPKPGKWDRSLAIMRKEMLGETDPIAAIFVGGMDGIRAELEMFQWFYPQRPVYPIAKPGGESARLLGAVTDDLKPALAESTMYPVLLGHIVDDIARR